MTMQANPCRELPLDLLLSDEAGGELAREMTGHLEQCPRCQARLAELAGEERLWNEVRESLSGSSELDWAPDPSWATDFTSVPMHETESWEAVVRGRLAPPSHPELLGRLGRYDVERVIGAGGMGVVLKAHDSELNRPVAIKMLASHLAHVGAARERFSREGRAAAAVVHEHVVAIYNVESGGEAPFLVMQYVPGRSLQARVDEAGPLSVEEILRIGMQAASGLAAAHEQGLVHRDVKPSNILLEESVERAVLTDFGLARTIDDASLTRTGVLAGTPHYMSPEQAMGEAIDHRSDLFSLGAVLYFMATGHPPFRAEGALAVLHRISREKHRPVWQVNKEIPDALSELIDRLLQKRPHRRPASAAEVAEQLASQLHRIQQFGPASRRAQGWNRWAKGRRVAAIAAITVFGGLAAAAGLRALLSSPTNDAPAAAGMAESAHHSDEAQHIEHQDDGDRHDAHDAVLHDDAVYLETWATGESWSDEVDAIKRDLSRIELELGLNSQSKE